MQTAEYLATYLDHPSRPQLANEEGWILVTTHCQISNKIKNNLRKTSSRNVTEFFVPLNTKQVTWEMFFPADLALHGIKETKENRTKLNNN